MTPTIDRQIPDDDHIVRIFEEEWSQIKREVSALEAERDEAKQAIVKEKERYYELITKCAEEANMSMISVPEMIRKFREQNERLKAELETFFNELYEKCPDMKEEGLESFDGYFTTWDEIISVFKKADPNVCWDDSPKELLVTFFDEYDLFKAENERLKAEAEDLRIGLSAALSVQCRCFHDCCAEHGGDE